MGKYNQKFDGKLQGIELQNVRNVMLCDIANELAEANRLKRLELQSEYFEDKDLEDQV